MPVKTILFVCYGNIARSLMAEGYLKKMASEHNLKIQVSSAGLNAQGLPPTRETLEIMKKEQIDLSNRTARQLTRELLEQADLVLTMEEIHKKAILFYYPQLKNKVFRLKEFAGEIRDLDIQDPYGKNIKVYEARYEEIKSSILKSFDKIVKFLGAD
jgi:protein-tyrosine phosphatase